MITLSLAIMAHPKRAQAVEEIIAEIGFGDIEVVWDEKNSRWDTGRRSMLAYDPACTHHAVIQDDVLVCRDLIPGLIEALGHIPADVPLCGYVGKTRPAQELVAQVVRRAGVVGASFITMHTLNWGPLIAVPTAHIPAMIEHCDPLRDVPNYDRRLSRYWELNVHKRIWYTWPSIVDHRDGPSLVKGRIGTDRAKNLKSRVAHSFLGCDMSALEVDWSGPVVHEEISDGSGLITYRHRTSGQEVRLQPSSPRARRLRGVPSWERICGGAP